MSLTPVDDLRNYMDRKEFNSREAKSAQMIIDGLEGMMQRILRRPITVTSLSEDFTVDGLYNTIPISTEFQNATLDTSSFPYVTSELNASTSPYVAVQQPFLLELKSPVTNVTNVTINGTVAVVNQDYVVRRFGLDMYAVSANDLVHVDYSAGWSWASYPELQLLILRAASREMTLMVDDTYGIKDLETFSRHIVIPVPGFNQVEMDFLKSIRRRNIA